MQSSKVTDDSHRLYIETTSAKPVRIFGVAMERPESPGVVLDTLGINGSRARYHLMWDDALYREHLAKRNPDLVVLAYGTNESGDNTPIEEYATQLEQVLGRIREVAPQASCLLVGPSDRPIVNDDGSFEDRPRTHQVIQVQYQTALKYGCGFYDLVSFMGGPLSITKWTDTTPPYSRKDYVHLTGHGYKRIAELLYEALMHGYPAPKQSNTED